MIEATAGKHLFILDGTVTIDHLLLLIRGFEQLAIQFLITLATLSGIARWSWGELKQWRPLKTQNHIRKRIR